VRSRGLLRVQLEAVVAADDPAHHDRDSEIVRHTDEAAERLRPGRRPPALLEVEPEGATDAGGRLLDVTRQAHGAHERERRFALGAGKVAVPLLALLAEVTVSSRSALGRPRHSLTIGPEVWDGTFSTGGSERKRYLTGV
jgi:hypothetical protein